MPWVVQLVVVFQYKQRTFKSQPILTGNPDLLEAEASPIKARWRAELLKWMQDHREQLGEVDKQHSWAIMSHVSLC